jgi:hypothetical protein
MAAAMARLLQGCAAESCVMACLAQYAVFSAINMAAMAPYPFT